MGVLKNDVGRPSNKTIKTRMIIRIIVSIVIVGLVFLTGYLLSGHQNKKVETSKEKISINEAEKILNEFVYGNYYLLTKENFSDEYKTILAIVKTEGEQVNYTCKSLFGDDIHGDSNVVIDDGVEYKEYIYTVDDRENFYGACYDNIFDKMFYRYENVNKNYKKLFGSQGALKENVGIQDTGGESSYGYSDSKNGYVKLSCEYGSNLNYEMHHINNAYIKNEELHIEFSFFNYINDLNNDGKLSLLNGYSELGIYIDNIKFDELHNENIDQLEKKLNFVFEEYKDKLPTYEIILEKENNNYIFKDMKEINS